MIKDVLNHYGIKPKGGRYGIEIETEVEDPLDYPHGFYSTIEDAEGRTLFVFDNKMDDFWVGHEDHSCRHFPIEYVFHKPLDFNKTLEALDIFHEYTVGIPFLKEPPGCSVHVHVNFSDQSIQTLGNFVTLWLMFENILTAFSGPTRRSNLFALPARCAEGVVTNFVRMFSGLDKKNYSSICISEEVAKYGGINPCPLTKFGSVEIRTFRGTTDANLIKEWISILDRIFTYSQRDTTPDEIVLTWRDFGMDFFREVFGDYSERLLDGIHDPEGFVERNLFYVGLGIAESVEDWRKIDEKFEPKVKMVVLDELVQPPVPQLQTWQTLVTNIIEDSEEGSVSW